MIPLRDVIPSRTFPFITVLIIVLNTMVFAFQWSLSAGELRAFAVEYGLVPAAFDWPSVITSMFLHGGLLHFLGNMLFLWVFGDNVEDRMGHTRFVVFYLMCGVGAALAQVASGPESAVPMVGASGAIAGVMGAYLVLFPRSRVLTLMPLLVIWWVVEVPAVLFLGVWFLIQLFASVGSLGATTGEDVGGVAFWAHSTGFIIGAVAVFFFRRPERQRVDWWHR
jgi:membrane associated rhomboid family serine protease